MFKAIFTNSFGILVSRVLGFIRDLLTASILGANIYSDIFFVAFKLPNLFRRIFAEGAFTQAFLPSFISAHKKGRFTVEIFARLMGIILLLSIIVTIFSELTTKLIAFGFDDETVAIASTFTAINFYYLDLIFVVTFLSALLHYRKHFATTSFSTALLNISLIGALLISKDMGKIDIVWYLSWGVIVGGILQVIVHIIAIKQVKMCKVLVVGLRSKKEDKNDRKRFYNSFIPAIFGSSTAHISAFLDTFLASFLIAGSISYLYYANRILQLPLALFAIATATALFPTIAKALKRDDENEAIRLLEKSFWILTALLSMSTLGAIVLNQEIISLLFERGAFTEKDTLQTAQILTMYMVGLIPFGIAKIFSLWLYGKHQQKTAAIISAKALGVNIVFALLLITPFEAQGLALASSIGGVTLLYLSLKEFGFSRFFPMIKMKYVGLLVIALFVEYGILKLLLNNFSA
ncbi:MAG: murein biosynthesis integral membrane protein MurJ [Campylobacterales bacterium]|nr:murein biosynthesis integral membrane protein MurJ [Campylobacterales bacterium]